MEETASKKRKNKNFENILINVTGCQFGMKIQGNLRAELFTGGKISLKRHGSKHIYPAEAANSTLTGFG